MQKVDIKSIAKTGITIIDEQHKELLCRINKFFDVLSSGVSGKDLDETATFMERYIALHFSTEEDYMLTYNYPGYANHKRVHGQFIELLASFKDKIASEGPSAELAEHLYKELGDWYINHTSGMDMDYVPFLKDKIGT